MADTVVTDAIAYPQDEGLPNISDGNESWLSAGTLMGLAQAVDSGSYVRDESALTFTGHDPTNGQVDVTAGRAYLDLTGETVTVQSATGGSSAPSYDTTLSDPPAIMVELPTTTADLPVQSTGLSAVWLAYATDGTVTGVSTGDVYLRSDDTGSVTAPPHPTVKVGEADPNDSGADVLSNRGAAPTFQDASLGSAVDHDATTNYVANEHVDHSTVSVTGGGTFITGGGDLTANRTLSLSGNTNALDGSAGTDGQVWTSTGTGAQWESVASGGSAVEVDIGNDDTAEVSDLTRVNTANDTNSVFSVVNTDELLADLSNNVPGADVADGLSTAALDAIGEIDAAIRTGADTTLATGTAGTGGNLVEWNADGDAVDSGTATSSVFTASSEVDHDATTNFVSNEHIDHSTVSISAGTALTGGGDLTATRTLNVDETAISHDNLSGFVANEHTDYRQDLIESPNAPIPSVELQDSANSESGSNEYFQITHRIQDGETITVYRWEAYDNANGTEIQKELIDGSGTVQGGPTSTEVAPSTTGVASYTYAPGDDSSEIVKLRATNDTGADISSAGGCFAYEVS